MFNDRKPPVGVVAAAIDAFGGPTVSRDVYPPPTQWGSLVVGRGWWGLSWVPVDGVGRPAGELLAVLDGLLTASSVSTAAGLGAAGITSPAGVRMAAPTAGSGAVSGAVADAEGAVAAAQRSREGADALLSEGLRAAAEVARSGDHRLRQLRAEVVEGVAALQAMADVPAGRVQLVEFVQAKAAELRALLQEVAEGAKSAAAVIDSATVAYRRLIG